MFQLLLISSHSQVGLHLGQFVSYGCGTTCALSEETSCLRIREEEMKDVTVGGTF
jgi:hypothetical protein